MSAPEFHNSLRVRPYDDFAQCSPSEIGSGFAFRRTGHEYPYGGRHICVRSVLFCLSGVAFLLGQLLESLALAGILALTGIGRRFAG